MGEEKDAVRGLGGFETAGRGAGLSGSGGAGGAGGERDPDRIRSDIERTRQEMGETVEEIKERLSRENIKAQVREATVGRAGQVAGDTSRKVKAASKAAYCNAVSASYDAMSRIVRSPLPAVLIPVSLIGTGLAAWGLAGRKGGIYEDIEIDFLPDFEEAEPDVEGADPLTWGEPTESGWTGGEQTAERYGRRYRRRAREAVGLAEEAAGAAQERAGRVVRKARAGAEAYARRTRESAGRIGSEMRGQAREVGAKARRAPGGWSLFLAVAGVLAGMAAGFLLPESQTERAYFGKARERLRVRVREAGRDVAATVRETAETAAEAAKRAAGE
jgi:hypothetical protein